MIFNDKELKNLLSDGPFEGKGFRDRLRRKIEQEMDHLDRRDSIVVKRRVNRFVAAFCILLLVGGFGLWQWKSGSVPSFEETELAKDEAWYVDDTAITTNDDTPRSAILIGLRKDIRTDNASPLVSTYRTVLIVPEENRDFRVAAEGEGVYMPFKTSFWKIGAAASDDNERQKLYAFNVNKSKMSIIPNAPSDYTERLLFAGKQYLSVEQTTTDAANSKSYDFIQDVTTINTSVVGPTYDPETVSHITPEQEDGQAGTQEQWKIVREKGSWKAERPIGITVDKASQFADPLPEWMVGNKNETAVPDRLALTWEQIRQYDPSATDAFTAPTQDVLATVTPQNKIRIYAYRHLEARQYPQLELQLQAGESIVMVQWAQDKYVKNWADTLGKLIPFAKS